MQINSVNLKKFIKYNEFIKFTHVNLLNFVNFVNLTSFKIYIVRLYNIREYNFSVVILINNIFYLLS